MNLKKFLKRILKRKKKRLPVLYDRNNKPFPPPRNSKRKEARKYQRPSSFSKSEVDELLKKAYTKKGKLELSPP